ncbi:hypothetical protein V2J09_021535 [Rumex salicifolius]
MDHHQSRDYLSDLPLSIIHNILALIPVSDAVRTCVLSRQWRYTWASLPQLVFEFCQRAEENSICIFEEYMENFITHVLLHHEGPIHKFRMSLSFLSTSPNVDEWVLCLSRNDIRELIIDMDYDEFSWFVLHSIGSPAFVLKGFSFLRVLHLRNVYVPDQTRDGIEDVFANCPLLEKLDLMDSGSSRLWINAPNLKYLYLRGEYVEICLHAPLLAEMRVELEDNNFTPEHLQRKSSVCNYTNFLGGFNYLEKLIGDLYTMKYLSVGIGSCHLTLVFSHLKVIALSGVNSSMIREMLVVARLVVGAPNLEELTIDNHDFTERDYHPNVEASHVSFMNFRCALNSKFEKLRVVKMEGVIGHLLEMEFIRYLLENSPMLEEMSFDVSYDLGTEEKQILKTELLGYTCASPIAKPSVKHLRGDSKFERKPVDKHKNYLSIEPKERQPKVSNQQKTECKWQNTNWLHKTKRKSLFSALAKIKEENDFKHSKEVLRIAVHQEQNQSSVVATENYIRSNKYCPPGYESFASYESLEQLHRLMFILGMTHVTYSFLAIAMALAKIYSWGPWENEARTMTNEILREYPHGSIDTSKVKKLYSLIHNHVYNPWSQHKILVWATHELPFDYDFLKYMLRSMDEEFRDIVGISIPLWIYVIFCIFLNFHGTNIYFWSSFLPSILNVLIGTKLHYVVAKLAIEVKHINPWTEHPTLKLRDELFWFGKPKILLMLIQFISFQNALEMAMFIWSMWEIDEASCFMKNRTRVHVRLLFGAVSQIWCSFITFPLYVIVTQMGSRFKTTVVSEEVRRSLQEWRKRVRVRGGSDDYSTPKSSEKSGKALLGRREALDRMDSIGSISRRNSSARSTANGFESEDEDSVGSIRVISK